MPHKVIIDLDNAFTLPAQDTDDGMALALALASPELDLLACTACAGNCRAEQSAANTLAMLALAGRGEIPVAVGPTAPLVRDREAHLRYLAAKSAGDEARFWAGMPPPPAHDLAPDGRPAHQLIIDLTRQYPGQITFIALGSLTNLGLALLADPAVAGRLKEVVHMASCALPPSLARRKIEWHTPDIPGHVWQETLRFNTGYDPEAAAIVFRSGLPMRLLGIDVTTLVHQRPQDLLPLAQSPNPFQRHLHAGGLAWVTWSMAVRKLPGAQMHDPLAVAAVIDPAFCGYANARVDVARFLAEDGGWLAADQASTPTDWPRVAVADDVDVSRFEAFLATRLAGYRP